MSLSFSLILTSPSKLFSVSHLMHYMMLVLVSFLLCMGSFVSGDLSLGLKEDGNITITRSCIQKERQALLLFKANLVDIYNVLQDWGSGEEKRDCCKWTGVRCNNHTGHVIGLNLSTFSYGLAGQITPSLPLLHQLQYLTLNGIDFQSNVIPSFLGSLTNLRRLDISAANLSGPIPHQLANLSKLHHLDLSRNFLVGSIPFFFGDLTSLAHLDLSRNQLRGVIPNSFGNSSSLVLLDLSGNLLNGSLPDFVNCSSLSELFLAHNSLNGSIPDFARCQSLRKLDLSSNQLSGNLPNSVGQASSLEYLDVSSNSLKGVISDAHFLNLTQLTYLDLSFNSFAFELSSHWKFPSQLATIKLQSCKLGPSFPVWIRTQRGFTNLDISNAGISDTIPAWFWELPYGLKFLNLSSNEIRGMLPNMTSSFDGYPGMDLSYNHLEGRIPLLPFKLAALNLSGNRFSGTLSFLCQIGAGLTFLDLSNNLLSGSMPDCWLEFVERLVVLNLSNNNLSGEIPSSLGYFSELEALYLRANAFSGELPISLSSCTKLRFVDLGENKLSGIIPAWIGGSLSELSFLVLRSNRFYGSLPSQICWLNNLQLLDVSKNGISGSIPRCFGNFTAMASRRFGDDISNHSYYSYDGSSYESRPSWQNDPRYVSYEALTKIGVPCGPIYCAAREEDEFAVFIDNALVAWKGTERKFGKGLQLLKSIDLSSNKFSGKLPYEITSLHELVSLNFSMNKLHGEVPKHIGRLKSLQSLDLSRNFFTGNIPTSLSEITFLSYLDLSSNNLSGRIPWGPQLQLFNSSSYSGNPYLYGPPLTPRCGLPPATVVVKEDDEENEGGFWKSYYTSMGVGFAVGFWGICSTIFLNHRCIYFLFALLSHVKDWIYVIVAIHFRKF